MTEAGTPEPVQRLVWCRVCGARLDVSREDEGLCWMHGRKFGEPRADVPIIVTVQAPEATP